MFLTRSNDPKYPASLNKKFILNSHKNWIMYEKFAKKYSFWVWTKNSGNKSLPPPEYFLKISYRLTIQIVTRKFLLKFNNCEA